MQKKVELYMQPLPSFDGGMLIDKKQLLESSFLGLYDNQKKEVVIWSNLNINEFILPDPVKNYSLNRKSI